MKVKDLVEDLGEIELDDEVVEVVKQLGYDPKKVIERIFTNAFGLIYHRARKNRCDRCGKRLQITVPRSMRDAYEDDICDCY